MFSIFEWDGPRWEIRKLSPSPTPDSESRAFKMAPQLFWRTSTLSFIDINIQTTSMLTLNVLTIDERLSTPCSASEVIYSTQGLHIHVDKLPTRFQPLIKIPGSHEKQIKICCTHESIIQSIYQSMFLLQHSTRQSGRIRSAQPSTSRPGKAFISE